LQNRRKAPFKNILTHFKNAHKNFMIKWIEDHPELRRILNHKEIIRIFFSKKHISRFDYEILYNIDELKRCWG
jgi:hypothetical protein